MLRSSCAVTWSLIAVLVGFTASGCSPANPRKEITGKVTLKGTPLDEGVIEFVPISAASPDLPTSQSGGLIKNGEYKLEAETGLVPGKYKVVITAGDSKSPEDPNQAPGPSGNYVMKDRIPPDFNTQSKQQIDVTDKGPNNFDFAIP